MSTIVSGLWSTKTKAEIVRKGHAGGWKVSPTHNGSVQLDKLDNLVTRADLIHLDVEGSEFHVLTGGERLIKQYLPMIIMELNHDSETAVELLKSWGYVSSGPLMERDQLFIARR
jgi:hypothetical protein